MPISHFVVLPLHSASLCQFFDVPTTAAPVQSAFPCQLLMLPMYAGTCADAPYLASIAVPIHGASFPRHQSSTAHAELSVLQKGPGCYLPVHPDNSASEFSIGVPVNAYLVCAFKSFIAFAF